MVSPLMKSPNTLMVGEICIFRSVDESSGSVASLAIAGAFVKLIDVSGKSGPKDQVALR